MMPVNLCEMSTSLSSVRKVHTRIKRSRRSRETDRSHEKRNTEKKTIKFIGSRLERDRVKQNCDQNHVRNPLFSAVERKSQSNCVHGLPECDGRSVDTHCLKRPYELLQTEEDTDATFEDEMVPILRRRWEYASELGKAIQTL